MLCIRRRIFAAGLAALTLAAAPAGAATTERVYAVVSVVADHLTVTGFETTTGSLVAQNQTERIELQTDELERSVVRAAVSAVQASGLGRALPLLTDDGRLYAQQATWIDGEQAKVPSFLLQTLRAQKATHLLLVTKHRGEARMRSHDADLGTGRVEGLGFYLDRVTPLRRVESGERAVGYLAPHAFLRLSLIELSTGRMLAAKTVTASRVVSAAGSAAGASPWDVMSSADKFKMLDDLITRATAPVWRELLGAP